MNTQNEERKVKDNIQPLPSMHHNWTPMGLRQLAQFFSSKNLPYILGALLKAKKHKATIID